MAKATLLETDIAAGAGLVRALDDAGKDVNAAFWLYYPDLAQWKLVIASPSFDRCGLTKAFTDISHILSTTDELDENISVSDVKILNPNDPMIKLLKAIVHTGKGVSQVRMTSNVVDGIYVEDALIYRNV